MAMNLVEAGGFRPSHDVIFCHNVLIYFAPDAVTRVVAQLASCLTLGGYLLLGPGEAPSDRPPGLEPVSVNGVRAFQRKSRQTRRGARMTRPMQTRRRSPRSPRNSGRACRRSWWRSTPPIAIDPIGPPPTRRIA